MSNIYWITYSHIESRRQFAAGFMRKPPMRRQCSRWAARRAGDSRAAFTVHESVHRSGVNAQHHKFKGSSSNLPVHPTDSNYGTMTEAMSACDRLKKLYKTERAIHDHLDQQYYG